MIMYCIVSGNIPNQTTDQIKKGNRPDIPEDCDPKLRTMILDLWKNNPNDRPPMIYIIKALYNYDTPLFKDTNMGEYKEYRERLMESTFFTEQDQRFLKKPISYKQDIEYFEKTKGLAKKGDIESMKKVARMFELGIETDINIEKAIKWYQKAADKDDPESIYKIANFYLTDNEVFDKDEKESIKLLEKSCNLGFPPAMSDYAYIISQTDPEKAIKILKEIADPPTNNKEAQYRLATIYDSQGNEDEAINYYTLSSNQNFLPAKADIAQFLLKGKTGKKTKIKKNIKEGLKLLEEVARWGFPMAYFNLGIIYQKGLFDQKQDLKKAINYYKLGEKNGSSDSMVELGKAYFKGIFEKKAFEKDEVRAARLFERAANLNNPEGLYSWALFELNGYGGTPVYVEQAIDDLKSSANLNFPNAMLKLSELLDEGVNGIKDKEAAKQYLDQYTKITLP